MERSADTPRRRRRGRPRKYPWLDDVEPGVAYTVREGDDYDDFDKVRGAVKADAHRRGMRPVLDYDAERDHLTFVFQPREPTP